ncbi:unnamed protein product [Acanthoscelides obtectus]|uniref:Uncharacterized protein n=1 Tax=Acanthoscelides obtectus TaxID=200917 RepID=A0A9P0LA40_ACAOB|nr:unnamed protein product [Acanthoscelides obtectus]CAK1640521.1 hypothetical protein AOBTE_LOCUS11774 [Acanthoscelides obtectus]
MGDELQILEDFVIDLIRCKKIHNYTAKLKVVQAFYGTEYAKKKTKCSFEDFLLHLWYYWYISRYSKKYIYFDQQWVNYLSQTDKVREVENTFSESNYVNKKYCMLCDFNFTSSSQRDIHLKRTDHQIRLQYVKDKTVFDSTEDILSMKIQNHRAEGEDLSFYPSEEISAQQNTITIRTKTKHPVEATLLFTNRSGKTLYIKEVVQINPFLSGVEMDAHYISEQVVHNKESISIKFKLSFRNSSDFSMPLVVVTTNSNILKNIIFEVTSEYSVLKSEGVINTRQNAKPDNDHVILGDEEIIPGKKPEPLVFIYISPAQFAFDSVQNRT